MREASQTLLTALAEGDASAMWKAIAHVNSTGAWATAARRLARLSSVRPEAQAWFLELWIEHGDGLRGEAGSHADLLAALQAMLPPYTGPGLTLYRGDSAWNRRRRSYGLSWTANEDVADSFAQGMWQTFTGGSVLLQAEVPAAAIICQVHGTDGDRFKEAEFLVDRRKFASVIVRRRYAQRELVVKRPGRALPRTPVASSSN